MRRNSLGQLTGVRNPSYVWVYDGYNGMGMRVRRTQGGVDRRFLYDGAELAAEVTGAGARLRTYAHFPGIDVPHSVRQWESGQNGAVHFYALELPGNNVQGLFNASGSITHSYRYSPWGEAQVVSEGSPNPLRFASREWDETAGLYYNRARWYDPYLGRFLSEDPIGIDGGINVYAYAGNDPVNFTDPLGLFACPGPNCLDPIVVVGRPRGWLRARWDDLFGTRRWGGLSGGRGPTSIMGNAFAWNAEDETDLLEESVEVAEVFARAASAVWECKWDAAGIVVGAIAGGAAKKLAGAAKDVRQRGEQLYQLGHGTMGPLPNRGLAQDGVALIKRANAYDVAVGVLELTQVGSTVIGLIDFGSCLAENY